MILVTVGLLLPFDRLIRLMDGWAARHPHVPVVAQIGAGGYEPRHMRWLRQLDGPAFRAEVERASLLVAHAGTGSVFDALALGKPMVLVPRHADRREHTTDHQRHMAERLRHRPGIVICEHDDEIGRCIGAAGGPDEPRPEFSPHAPPEFLARLRAVLLA